MTFPTISSGAATRWRRSCLAGAAVLLAGLASCVAPAAASSAATASGTFTFVSDTRTPIRTADGNTIVDEVASIAYAGDLSGTVTATDTIVVHPDGSVEGHGREVCDSCTIGGRTGAFTALFAFRGSATHFAGSEVFVDGSGGLKGLRGGGTFEGNGASNTYSYHYQFERR
jgi:hypothetical protein